jgi:CheY-specific phosphatase CheX
MEKTLTTQITDATSEVIETMFYQPIEFRSTLSLAASGIMDAAPRACAIGFSGSVKGTLFLLMPDEVLEFLTRSFLGLPQEAATSEEKEGTLREALNMIASSTLARMDPGGSHPLGIPEEVPAARAAACGRPVIFETARGYFALAAELS